MLKKIKNVKYVKKTMLSSEEYFQLEVNKDRNVLKYIDNKYIDNHKIENVDNELVIQYLDQLFRIIASWKNKYENNNVVDGVEWQLLITYKDGEKKHYFGKNDFPNNFEYLDKIKYEIIDKTLERKI